MDTIQYILDCVGIVPEGRAIQAAQTEHRLRLLDFWAIPAGASVLEIGCGQGDMTAALACHVGERGFVHGIDIAEGSYGAPSTLAQARDLLLASPLGARLRIDFETDILSDRFAANRPYDYVVFSHCAWYLASRDQLLRILQKTRALATGLCFAEWDARPRQPAQLPHGTAAMIQAQYAAFDPQSTANIRTLFYPADILSLAVEAGWRGLRTGSIHSPALQDGQWEIDMTVQDFPVLIRRMDSMPPKLKDLLLAQIRELADTSPVDILPLDVFALAASR